MLTQNKHKFNFMLKNSHCCHRLTYLYGWLAYTFIMRYKTNKKSCTSAFLSVMYILSKFSLLNSQPNSDSHFFKSENVFFF